MRKLMGILAIGLLLAALPACGGSSSSSATRTVHLDYNSDQFASAVFAFTPNFVPVHAGDKIEFQQTWTGEPHTVTFGANAQALGDAVKPYLSGAKPVPDQEPPEAAAEEHKLPEFFGDHGLNQTAAQPCFLDTGAPPADGKPCPQRPQPAFDGTQAWYSSGFIPYGGNQGNHYEVRLSKTIKPGDYYFFCLVHGAAMAGYLQVKPANVKVPSQSELNKTARQRFDIANRLLAKGDSDAKKGKDKPAGVNILAGANMAQDPKVLLFGSTLEFYPKKFTAKVGQKITWSLNGHTVSFDVPKYLPLVFIDKDGTVRPNPKTNDPINAPKAPDTGGGRAQNGPPPPPSKIDAGSYDGSKFLSSGTNDNEWFTLTFTKPGTYQYACLVHPRMVGTVVIAP